MNPLISMLEEIPDPRSRSSVCRYTVGEIVFLTLCGILAGETDLVAIAEWGEYHLPWLKNYQQYRSGVPSHDTLGRVLGMIKPGFCSSGFFHDHGRDPGRFAGVYSPAHATAPHCRGRQGVVWFAHRHRPRSHAARDACLGCRIEETGGVALGRHQDQ